MRKITISTEILAVTYDELNDEERLLIDFARDANKRSYAPYSKFCVGAAIKLDNGEIITGANQENVAYPSGTCAERSACFYAHARFPDANFKAIAIAARDGSGNEVTTPISPCGACRQSLLEYETLSGKNIKVSHSSPSHSSISKTTSTCLENFPLSL